MITAFCLGVAAGVGVTWAAQHWQTISEKIAALRKKGP